MECYFISFTATNKINFKLKLLWCVSLPFETLFNMNRLYLQRRMQMSRLSQLWVSLRDKEIFELWEKCIGIHSAVNQCSV